MSRTERLLADVERGFEALENGEIEIAASIVERCRRIDRHRPEVVMLAAALADAEGDTEEALTEYGLLSELQPDNPMPRICIARLQLHDLGDSEAALETLATAFTFIDEEDDLIEAIFIRSEALIDQGELGAARESLAELSTSVIDDPDLALELAELALAAEDATASLRWIETARAASRAADRDADEQDAFEADALHLLGRVHEATEDRAAMIAAWQQVLALDRKAPAGELSVSEDELERIALDTLAELPETIRTRLEKVPILIDDLPSEEIVADGYDPRMLGIFQGAAMPQENSALPTVTNILLFRTNLERHAVDEEHLAEEIRITVLHETAHYFGLDEDDLEKLGLD